MTIGRSDPSIHHRRRYNPSADLWFIFGLSEAFFVITIQFFNNITSLPSFSKQYPPMGQIHHRRRYLTHRPMGKIDGWRVTMILHVELSLYIMYNIDIANTQTIIYIYIYIYRERERERGLYVIICDALKSGPLAAGLDVTLGKLLKAMGEAHMVHTVLYYTPCRGSTYVYIHTCILTCTCIYTYTHRYILRTYVRMHPDISASCNLNPADLFFIGWNYLRSLF